MDRPQDESPSTGAEDRQAAEKQSGDQSTEQDKETGHRDGKSDTVLGNLNKGPEKRFIEDENESDDSDRGSGNLDHDDGSVLGNINEDGRGRKRLSPLRSSAPDPASR